jgi:hypothetical protein
VTSGFLSRNHKQKDGTFTEFNIHYYFLSLNKGSNTNTDHFSHQLELAKPRVISGFHSEVSANCNLLGYYAASGGNFLPTFRYNLPIPAVSFKNRKERF